MADLYERVLEAASGMAIVRPRPARDSAAVIPWRIRDGHLEVLWMRRPPAQRFMGGWWAFPGGGVARDDGLVPIVGSPVGIEGIDEMGALPPAMLDHTTLGRLLDNVIVVAALRELAEEMGWLVCDPPLDPLDEQAIVDRLRQGDSFAQLLKDANRKLRADELIYAGRWLTPPLGPLRFDNRFFLLHADDRQPQAWLQEVEEAEWIRPVEGIRRWQRAEVMAAPPVLHTLQVLAECAQGPLAQPSTLQRLTAPTETNVGPFRRLEFQPGVLLFPLITPTLPPAATTNCFVLGAKERVVVDPGSPFPEQQQRLLDALAQLPGGLGSVKQIWLTHQHPDHIGGAAALAGHLGVPIAAHEKTAALLSGQIAVDRYLKDGERIQLEGASAESPDLDLTVLHTPGHASGHLCFASNDGHWLLAGDMISGVSTIVIDTPDGNMSDYYSSLRRLAELDPYLVLPAHGPALLDGAKHFSRALKHRQWREERIRSAWEKGERKVSRLVKAAYEEKLPPFLLPLAKRQVKAHLQHLQLGTGSDQTSAGTA